METAATSQEIVFKTTITASEARETIWRGYYRGRFLRIAILYAIAFIVAAVSLRRGIGDNSLVWLVMALVLGVLTAVGALYGVAIFAQGYAVARCNRRHSGAAWRVTDEGAKIEEGETTVVFKWGAFQGFIETTRLILIRLVQKTTYLTIPKRCLTPTEREGLLSILSAKLPRIKT